MSGLPGITVSLTAPAIGLDDETSKNNTRAQLVMPKKDLSLNQDLRTFIAKTTMTIKSKIGGDKFGMARGLTDYSKIKFTFTALWKQQNCTKSSPLECTLIDEHISNMNQNVTFAEDYPLFHSCDKSPIAGLEDEYQVIIAFS